MAINKFTIDAILQHPQPAAQSSASNAYHHQQPVNYSISHPFSGFAGHQGFFMGQGMTAAAAVAAAAALAAGLPSAATLVPSHHQSHHHHNHSDHHHQSPWSAMSGSFPPAGANCEFFMSLSLSALVHDLLLTPRSKWPSLMHAPFPNHLNGLWWDHIRIDKAETSESRTSHPV